MIKTKTFHSIIFSISSENPDIIRMSLCTPVRFFDLKNVRPHIRTERRKIPNIKKFNDVKGNVHFENEPTIMRIRVHARKTFKPIDKDESGRLKELFRGYESLSRWENMLNDNEYLICMLVKLNFVPAEICTLTGLSSSNVSNIRKRLLVKMGGREGSPKDFDKYIKSL